jgi:hypothetical protein
MMCTYLKQPFENPTSNSEAPTHPSNLKVLPNPSPLLTLQEVETDIDTHEMRM